MSKPTFDPTKSFEPIADTSSTAVSTKPPFDPSKTFEEVPVPQARGNFNPEEDLKKHPFNGLFAKSYKEAEENPADIPLGVRNFVQAGSAGLSDEAAGLIEGAGRAVGVSGAGGPMKDIARAEGGPTLDWDTLKKSYYSGRDKERAALEEDAKKDPKSVLLAQIAGSLASPINKILPNASLAKQGAAMGLITGFGTSNADNATGVALDTTGGVLFGGLLGKGTEIASPYIEKGAAYVGKRLKDTGENLAYKAGGARFKDYIRRQGESGNAVGRFMLDNGLVKPLDTVDSISAKAIDANKAAGSALDDIYNRAATAFKDKMENVGFNPVKDKEQILSAAKKEIGDEVDGAAALNKLSNYLDEVAANNGDKIMTPRRANDIKSAMDKKIKYSRNPVLPDPANEQAFYGARKAVQEKVEQSINDLGGGDMVDALKKANKEYGMSKEVTQIAKDKISRENANKAMFGLTDTIAATGAGAYGAATGDWKGAVEAMAIKKGFEKYGVSTIASAANKIGTKLLQAPELQQTLKNNPKVFSAMVFNLIQNMEKKGVFHGGLVSKDNGGLLKKDNK